MGVRFSMEAKKLAVGLPSGSLKESTFDLFRRAGYRMLSGERSYFPYVDDPELECRMFRAQEMSLYVGDGVLDVGLTGKDWIEENGSDVVEIAELVYSKSQTTRARWVVAVRSDSPVRQVSDLNGKLVATELVNATKKYFQAKGVNARVEYSFGATEAKADFVDAIVEITETGSSLRSNNLRVVDTVLVTSTRMIANKQAWGDPWKRRKAGNLATLLKGALVARAKVGLKMNVPPSKLETVLAKLDALRRPTVSPLADESGFAVETIVDETVARDIIPELKRAGAEGIVEYPLNMVIP